MRKKEWEPERLFEVFQNAVEANEKFQLAEGAPENFYEMEPLFLVSHIAPVLILDFNRNSDDCCF